MALVGHTGAGKSSLGKLVARFCEFQGGQLLVDGRDIRSFDLAEYHRHLGIVPQTPFLFSGSVADNIRYARPDASDETARAIAGQIGGGDWLEALPDGLDTIVGEGGRGLSIGQRQLIALALVLRQGQIIEEGTHDSLMAGGGHYAELYNTYFRHQSLDYHIPDAILS